MHLQRQRRPIALRLARRARARQRRRRPRRLPREQLRVAEPAPFAAPLSCFIVSTRTSSRPVAAAASYGRQRAAAPKLKRASIGRRSACASTIGSGRAARHTMTTAATATSATTVAISARRTPTRYH